MGLVKTNYILTPADVWTYVTRSLNFREIADALLAAGAAILPNFDGLFTAVLDTGAAWGQVQIFSNTGANWLNVGDMQQAVHHARIFVGEAQLIRFLNNDGVGHNVVVNQYG